MIHLEDITEEVEIPQPGEINLFGKFFGDIIPLSCRWSKTPEEKIPENISKNVRCPACGTRGVNNCNC